MPHFRVDLHNHCQGDPIDTLRHTIFEHIDAAKAAGLDAIAITWHQRIFADKEAQSHAQKRGLLLIPGMEAEVKGKHLVLLGLEEGDLAPRVTWDEVRVLRRRKPGILIFAPHPFYPHPTCLHGAMYGNEDCLDAVEWCALHTHLIPNRMNPNFRAARWAHRHGKPLLACSDAHTLSAIGKNPSTVEADDLTQEAIFAGIRAGRVTFPRHSLGFGELTRGVGVAIASQPRDLVRWVRRRLRRRGASRS